MERKSGPEPSSITSDATAVLPANKKLRMVSLCALMLWPWLCIAIGLFYIQDYRITMLMYGILCCAIPTLIFRRPLKYLPTKKVILPTIGLTLLLFIFMLWVFQLSNFGIQPDLFLKRTTAIHLQPNQQLIEYGLYFIIINPILEEIFWRGLIYEEWKQLVPVWPARLISSFFFGAWHWVIVQHFCSPLWAILLTLFVVIGGLLFSQLYDKSNALGPAIFIHSLGADLPLVIIVFSLLIG